MAGTRGAPDLPGLAGIVWTEGGRECSEGPEDFAWGGWPGSGLEQLATSRNKEGLQPAGQSLPSHRPPGAITLKHDFLLN